jgi:hypothetical protein
LVLRPPGKSELDTPTGREYMAVSELFEQFIGSDKIRGFEIEKIVAIDNGPLEKAFTSKFNEFVKKKHSREWSKALDQKELDWRKWILNNFDKCVRNVSGEEGANLILAWHGGASEAAAMSIAEENFAVQSKGKTDAGYFGKGIYFTQYPSYGDMYSQWKKNKSASKERFPLILSWIVMGEPYPVRSLSIQLPFIS